MGEPMPERKFREDGSHYNGGKVFFGYGYRCTDEPRLKMIRKWFRQGEKLGTTEDTFFVDGARVENYAAAIEALKVPTVFTPAEIEALRQIGDTAADLRKAIGFELLHALGDKAAIEWGPPGQCRRTDVGRAAIENHPRPLAEVLRTGVLDLTEAEIGMLDAAGQAYARRAQAQHAREQACPGHELVGTGTHDDARSGWHPGKCRHCGMDMSRDSGG